MPVDEAVLGLMASLVVALIAIGFLWIGLEALKRWIVRRWGR